jgi:alanyl-tRNA synthetase
VDRSAAPEALARLVEQNRALQREIERLKVAIASGEGGGGVEEVREVAGVRVLVPKVQRGLDKGALRALVDRNRERLPSGVIVQWAAQEEDRVQVTTSVSKDLIPPLHAGEIVKALAPLVEGRGGGRADMAEAGGRRTGDLEGVREQSISILENLIREARGQ